MKTYKVITTVTEQDIESILSSAFGGSGIDYWCDGLYTVDGRGGWPKNQYHSEALSHPGHYVMIHDYEADKPKWHRLTLKKLLKGLALAQDLNFDEYDGPASDRIVQLALFGEVIYG